MPQRMLFFCVGGPIARSDLPGLSARLCSLLSGSKPDIAFCDVSAVEADAVTVEALARLQLAARRHGCHVCLVRASKGLSDLVAFMGLRGVFSEATYRAAAEPQRDRRDASWRGRM